MRLLDFTDLMNYYNRKKVTYEYNNWRRENESVLLP